MTNTATLTLTEFLLARIAEDEDAARAADSRPWWISARNNGYSDVHDEMTGKFVALQVHDRHADHIARYDPARVLAECEAKRRIVEVARQEEGWDMRWFLAPLALLYADHPDYREEWRP